MAGLAKGYVIPRLKVGKHDGSTVRDGLSGDSAHLAGRVALASDKLVEGCDSHQRTRAEYTRIYKLRCKFSKNFHANNKYYFRICWCAFQVILYNG